MKTVPSQQLLKTQLRKDIRQTRAGMDVQQRSVLDQAINRHLIDYVQRSRHEVISSFMAFDGEPDLSPAMSHFDSLGKRLALPVIDDKPGRAVISFREWTSHSKMVANRYGISEPVDSAEIQLPEIDLALIPLVAWDNKGRRLGMGASFYDRLLQPVSHLPRPVRMGVAYECQRVENIPDEPWDIGMHRMLSESGLIHCAA